MEVKGIILVEPKNPVNVGTIARTMAAFGIEKLIIISNKEKFKEISEKARKVSMGGVHVLENAEIYSSLKEINGKKIGTISIHDNKKYRFKFIPINKLKYLKGDYYLVFGREVNGLTYEELKICDLISTIPTNDKYGILNLAVSAIIYMYELNKNKFLDLAKYQNKYNILKTLRI